MDEEYMNQEEYRTEEEAGPSFAEMQQEQNEMREMNSTSTDEYYNMLDEPTRESKKDKGLPWYERKAHNPLEELIKNIIRAIMHLIDGSYRKNNIWEYGDSIQGRMDIRVTDSKKTAQKEKDEPEHTNEKTTEKAPERNTKKNETEQSKEPAKPSKGKETLNSENKESREKDENTKDSVESNYEETWKEIIRYSRDQYCLEKMGVEYKTLSMEEKEKISASFIVLEESNYNHAGLLEPEIVNSVKYREQLFEQYKEKIANEQPEQIDFVKEKILKDIPYYATYRINESQDLDVRNKKLALAMYHNPRILEYVPKEYIIGNLSDIVEEFRKVLPEECNKDMDRNNKVSTYKVLSQEDHISEIKELADNIADKTNVYEMVVNEIAVSYFVDYIQGANIKFHDEPDHEQDTKEQSLKYEDIVSHDKMKEIISNNIRYRPHVIERDQQDIEKTINRLEKEIAAEKEPDKRDWLENEMSKLADFSEMLNGLEKAYKELEPGKPVLENQENTTESEPTYQIEQSDIASSIKEHLDASHAEQQLNSFGQQEPVIIESGENDNLFAGDGERYETGEETGQDTAETQLLTWDELETDIQPSGSESSTENINHENDFTR